MNFAAVKQNIDLKDNKNYPLRVEMTGMITEFNGGAKVTMTDQSGEKHTVYLNGDMPPYTLANQWQSFSLGCANKVSKSSGRPYVAFSGFWQNRQPQQAAPRGGYSAPVPPQAPNYPPSAPNYPPPQNQAPRSDKDASICRQCAGKCVAEMFAAQPDMMGMSPLNALIAIADPLAEWFLTGRIPSVPEPEPESDDQGQGEDIPF
jgi:hypothetical protein